MSDRHYLGKVLGLSIVPRVFTSVLTLVSFPILLRAVGADQYGIIIYLAAVIGVVESMADFGVSSAAGKAIAEARARRPRTLHIEVARWARLQTAVALLGVIPVFGLTYLYIRYGGTIQVDLLILLLMVSTTWITIVSNFVKACIRSLLHFKSLMILDTLESVTRSATWIAVAWYLPNAGGVAAAGLATALVTSAAGVATLIYVVRAREKALNSSEPERVVENTAVAVPYREMIRESLHFLGLRFSTRMTQALPVIVIGRTVGAGVVGVVGAFSRIAELIGFPFAVIGNALSVRAQEVLLKDRKAVVALWDTVLRFEILAVVLASGLALISSLLAGLLLPGGRGAVPLFAILSITITTGAASSMIAPMSDYIGALPRRVAFLTMMSVAQVPLLYLGSRLFGPIGAVGAYVLGLCATSAGYVLIARRAFFGAESYRPAADVRRFFWIALGSFVLAACIRFFGAASSLSATQMAVIQAALFVAALTVGVFANRGVREVLIGGSLFDFTRET